MEKKRVTVYLDTQLVELTHIETNNMSELINNLLTSYLSINSTQDLDKEIDEHKKVIKVLESKRQKLIQQGATDDKISGMATVLFNELKNNYKLRRSQIGDNLESDYEWINSGKNMQRCRVIGKEPIVLVAELRQWYNNTGGSL